MRFSIFQENFLREKEEKEIFFPPFYHLHNDQMLMDTKKFFMKPVPIVTGKDKQDLLGKVSRLRKRKEQIPPLEWVGPEVR